jgi:hypothetical protein
VIEAVLASEALLAAESDWDCLPPWLAEAYEKGDILFLNNHPDTVHCIEVKTPEGTMGAEKGDWIIRGVKGEIYPCKPDIFAMTYDSVEEEGDEAPTLRNDAHEAIDRMFDRLAADSRNAIGLGMVVPHAGYRGDIPYPTIESDTQIMSYPGCGTPLLGAAHLLVMAVSKDMEVAMHREVSDVRPDVKTMSGR